jgi:hypothetical protein
LSAIVVGAAAGLAVQKTLGIIGEIKNQRRLARTSVSQFTMFPIVN